MSNAGPGGDWTNPNIYAAGAPQGQLLDYPVGRPPLRDSPFYLPNMIAAIVASVGIIVGAVGSWASVLAVSLGGLEVKPWGMATLVLGAASVIALFVLVNLSRTNFNLRWAVPVCWAVLLAAVGCLSIGLVEVVRIQSVGAQYDSELLTQVGWGLWLVVICAAILCITAPVVAAQTAKAAEAQASSSSSATWTSSWRWTAIGGSAVILIVALFNGYKPTRVEINVNADSTRTVTASPTTVTATDPERHGTGAAAVPADATPCPTKFANREFPTSAVGTGVTSCAFAEEVRSAYISNPARDRPVILDVYSPITGQTYMMTCTGGQVVRCTGGNNAVVYLH